MGNPGRCIVGIAHSKFIRKRGEPMASSKTYLEFILDQLSELEEITYRAMMGEFILYYRGRIVGGIYDDRLLVKPVKAAIEAMPNAMYASPYAGAKEMLLVDAVDNQSFLTNLFRAMYPELPAPKPQKRKTPPRPRWNQQNPHRIDPPIDKLHHFRGNFSMGFLTKDATLGIIFIEKLNNI